ncbi:hypothetical protein ACNKHU_05910 [Shigella flexneri]
MKTGIVTTLIALCFAGIRFATTLRLSTDVNPWYSTARRSQLSAARCEQH